MMSRVVPNADLMISLIIGLVDVTRGDILGCLMYERGISVKKT